MASGGPALPLRSLDRQLRILIEATISSQQQAPLPGKSWTASEELLGALRVICQASSLVKDTATKFSLVVGSSASASSPAVTSICGEMRSACEQLQAAYGVMRHPAVGACSQLMELYGQQTRAVLRAVEELVKHAQGPGRQQQSSLAPKTGAVWSACEQVERLPKSNKVAYRRALLQHHVALTDTTREFKDMLLQEEGGVEEALEALDLEDEDEEDFFGGASRPLLPWERQNVERVLQVLGGCGQLFRGVLAGVDERAGAEGGLSMEDVSAVEAACGALSAAVVNAADALYPPQVTEELQTRLQELQTAVQHLTSMPVGDSTACLGWRDEIVGEIAKGVVEGQQQQPPAGGEEEEEEEGTAEGDEGCN